MITIIFAPPRTGKTAFLTYIGCQYAFNRQRNRAMQNELLQKKNNGFTNIRTIPIHCVSANYDTIFKKFRYSPRYSRRINPFRLGFSNNYVKTHYNLPYECILITEAQKYFNSRMSMYYPDWQSRWFEQHGHNNLDIFLDTQRPSLIDVNIRELCQFIEIVKMKTINNEFGIITGIEWTIRFIENSGLFDKYISSGKKDESCFIELKAVADFNVFQCYDSQSCKPKFYDGHFEDDIDYNESKPLSDNVIDYIESLKRFDDEYVDGFYQSRSLKAKQ